MGGNTKSTSLTQQIMGVVTAAAIGDSIFGQVMSASQFIVMAIQAASISGTAVIVTCMGVAAVGMVYYVYTRCRDEGAGEKTIIDQLIRKMKINCKDILNRQEDNLGFEPIKMSKSQFDQMLSVAQAFTQQSFKNCVQNLICQSGSYQVMRKPTRMKCCQRFPDKVGQKSYIQAQLKENGRCLLCQSPADTTFMKFDDKKYHEIIGLRTRLVGVYKKANARQKVRWKSLIDYQFGSGYTQKHLENFQFSS